MTDFLNRKIQVTEDGSHTLYLPDVGEHFHSFHGAIEESIHVFIHAGFNEIAGMSKQEVRILETGFGTGLNALLTLFEAEKRNIRVKYTGVELYPLKEGEYKKLNYGNLLNRLNANALLLDLHATPWQLANPITPNFTLKKIKSDLLHQPFPPSSFDLIYFDVFAPTVQPELWSKGYLKTLFEVLDEGGIWVTYASRGQVRRDLEDVGFQVERLPGAAGKRHMLRARKV